MTARSANARNDYTKAWEAALKVELAAGELSAAKSRNVAGRLEEVYRLIERRAPLAEVRSTLREAAECL